MVALVGATASGKSRAAIAAAALSTRTIELVSVDSMAVYRGMDIGTAKPSPDERAATRIHLVDLVDASEEFTVQQFQQAGRRALTDIASRGHGALLVGGTGLHLRALIDDLTFPGRYPDIAADLAVGVEAAGPEGSPGRAAALAELHRRLAGLDPVAASRIEPGNVRRLLRAMEVTVGSGQPFSSFGPGLDRYPPTPVQLVGIDYDAGQLDGRIAERFERLMERGFLAEVRGLAARPGGLSRTARQALGYRELLSHLEGGVPLAEAVDGAVRRTRAFARRQLAWFRRDPRIVWLDPDADVAGEIAARFEEAPRGVASMEDWSPAP
jgi:tRNA dimethylallyltransferase